MTNTVKAVPAKKAPAKKTATPTLSVSSLQVTAAPPPRRNDTGSNSELVTAAKGWLANSWSNREEGESVGAGLQVPVPTANVKQLKYALNVAARQTGLGVAIREGEVKDGKTMILFAAKKRKAAKKTASTPSTTN